MTIEIVEIQCSEVDIVNAIWTAGRRYQGKRIQGSGYASITDNQGVLRCVPFKVGGKFVVNHAIAQDGSERPLFAHFDSPTVLEAIP